MKFELLVAIRYLKAKRKQAVISLITVISIIGVAAGVAALIIALAINAGFREDLQKKLLGAQAHISLLPKGREGNPNYLQVDEGGRAGSGRGRRRAGGLSDGAYFKRSRRTRASF